jgi:hypothetical protein
MEFFSLDSPEIKNLVFGFYPKTPLIMNLHRTTPIQAQNPSMILEIGFDNQPTIEWGLNQTGSNKDTIITINTSANIFTRIVLQKYTTPTDVVSVTDSIKCSLTGNNSIDIYY